MTIGRKELEKRFGRHKAALEAPRSPEAHAELREIWMEFTLKLDHILGEGRAKSVTFTELETASMWSHKALADTMFNETSEKTQVEEDVVCVVHRPVQHRDGREPWCPVCGFNADGKVPKTISGMKGASEDE